MGAEDQEGHSGKVFQIDLIILHVSNLIIMKLYINELNKLQNIQRR